MADTQQPGGLLGRLKASAGEVGIGLYAFVLSAATLLAVGFIGIVRKEPWVFPSLGPTVMLFFETPLQRAASAKNAVVGHLVGIAAGLGCLYALNLQNHPPVIVEGLSTPRVIAAAAAVAITAVVLRAIHCPHPPAGATTLIVALGILHTAPQVRTMVLSVIVITALAVLINRLVGVRHPLVSD